jgi:hypothetical protein
VTRDEEVEDLVARSALWLLKTLVLRRARRSNCPVRRCNTLNLGYKISSLISIKFMCYLSSHLYIFPFSSLLIELSIFIWEMYYFFSEDFSEFSYFSKCFPIFRKPKSIYLRYLKTFSKALNVFLSSLGVIPCLTIFL